MGWLLASISRLTITSYQLQITWQYDVKPQFIACGSGENNSSSGLHVKRGRDVHDGLFHDRFEFVIGDCGDLRQSVVGSALLQDAVRIGRQEMSMLVTDLD